MEDYDVFNEMQKLNDRQVIVVVEDNEDFFTQNLFNLNSVEVMPIRYNYDLSNFSNDYVEKTKTLLTKSEWIPCNRFFYSLASLRSTSINFPTSAQAFLDSGMLRYAIWNT